MAEIVVRELFVYPFKSARAVRCEAVRLVKTGFEWDRHWMAARPDGSFLSQRNTPKLALIRPEIGQDTMTLHAPDRVPLELPLSPEGQPVAATVWKASISALDQGDAAARWLADTLGTEARLLRVSPNWDRFSDPHYAGDLSGPVAFSDGFPLLVVNRASLDALNARLSEPVPMERFRPNLVIDGLEPFAEDHVAALELDGISLKLVKPCTRCVITATDQRTGERSTNPLPALHEFRFDPELKGVTFGENAVIERGVGALLRAGVSGRAVFEDA